MTKWTMLQDISAAYVFLAFASLLLITRSVDSANTEDLQSADRAQIDSGKGQTGGQTVYRQNYANDTSLEENQLQELKGSDNIMDRYKEKQSGADDRISSGRSSDRKYGSGRRRSSRRKSSGRQGRRKSKTGGREWRYKASTLAPGGRLRAKPKIKYPESLRYRTHQADASANFINEVSTTKNMSSKADYKSPGGVMPTSCDQLMCQSGGRCVKDEMRAGVRCQCPLGTQGQRCENEITIRHPKFDGSGYMAFPVLRGAYKEFILTIEFRPDTKNGLIVFSGELPTAMTDFFSITLVNGLAEFRFDCGTGMAQLRTTNQVIIRDWNTITVYRNEWDGWLQLNDGPQITGRSKGLYSRITFREDLYIGGYRNLSAAAARVGTRWGMIGCIRKMEINDKDYDMRKGAFVGDAIHGVDVGECSANVCDSVRCLNGGKCAASSADKGICLCPLGTAGRNCETRGDISVPSFDGNSFIQYIGLQRRVLSHTEIEITFKPTASDGLLLYNGYSSDGTGDFISIALTRGRVEFRFDLGTGPAIIRNDRVLTLNEWHTVKVSRTGRTGHLVVDNDTAKEGISQGAFTQLTLTLDMFIGGHRNFDEVAKKSDVSTGFRGCIQKISINDKAMNLVGEAIGGVNIGNCPHPCASNPCINGGLCVPVNDQYKCNCPLGFENKNCEDHVTNEVQLPMFSGNSYLKFSNKNVAERISGERFDIQISFKTNQSNGLLFWVGKDQMSAHGDYLALGLRRGILQFSYNLGSGEAIISYDKRRLDDGKWHHVRAQRNGRLGYLEIDKKEIVEGSSRGSLTNLDLENGIFLGGTDDIYRKTFRKFRRGFSGCITNVTLGTDYSVNMADSSVSGWNIGQCTS